MTIRNEFISHRISDFLRTKSIIYLFAAVILIFKQKRSLEIIYGIYCFLCFKPSKIKKDLGFSYTIGSASADLDSSSTADALVIIGK